AITILPAMADQEVSFNSAFNSLKQELAHAKSSVDQAVKEAVKANELKCNSRWAKNMMSGRSS
ncbi:hypothetical protein ACH5RR_012888, partial [Cinchona calisaya]